MNRSAVVKMICCVLMFVFIYTSLSKLLSLPEFIREMKNQPLPNWLKNQLVWLVPGSELMVSTLLAFNATRLRGLLLSSVLLGAFTLYAALIVTQSFTYIPCSCGGIVAWLSWEEHLFLNIILTSLSLVGLIQLKSKQEKDIVATKLN